MGVIEFLVCLPYDKINSKIDCFVEYPSRFEPVI